MTRSTSEAPCYCFRVRCNLGADVKIDSDDREWVLATEEVYGERVVLRPIGEDATLGDARRLALFGSPYASEDDAKAAGQRWTSILARALARMNLGTDFGDRAPARGWTPAGLEWMSQQAQAKVLVDVHGLMVFPQEPKLRFAALELQAMVGKPGAALKTAIEAAMSLDGPMSGQGPGVVPFWCEMPGLG